MSDPAIIIALQCKRGWAAKHFSTAADYTHNFPEGGQHAQGSYAKRAEDHGAEHAAALWLVDTLWSEHRLTADERAAEERIVLAASEPLDAVVELVSRLEAGDESRAIEWFWTWEG